MAFNKVIQLGNLTADPELKQTTNGVSVTRFSIAVQRSYGEDKVTDFFDAVAWRGTAEAICKHFHKGDMILVCGNLQNRQWQDNQGNKRVSTEINVQEFSFAGAREKAPKNDTQYTPTMYAQNTESFEEVTEDPNLPF
jgi:single-strand DNA-binding protein